MKPVAHTRLYHSATTTTTTAIHHHDNDSKDEISACALRYGSNVLDECEVRM